VRIASQQDRIYREVQTNTAINPYFLLQRFLPASMLGLLKLLDTKRSVLDSETVINGGKVKEREGETGKGKGLTRKG